MKQPSEKPQLLYLEDLRVGQRFISREFRMDAAGIKAFAAEFDPQPFHLDEAAAEDSFFHGLAASGWHTAAVTMRLLVESVPLAGGLVGLGGVLAWSKPTRPGDVLHVESEILELKPSRTKPDRGVATVRIVTLNQSGDQAQVFTAKILVFSRTTGAESPRTSKHE
jgi:acyl dehydratase